MKKTLKLTVTGVSGWWHVRLVAENGEIVMSSEVYFSKSNAKRAAAKLSIDLGAPIK